MKQIAPEALSSDFLHKSVTISSFKYYLFELALSYIIIYTIYHNNVLYIYTYTYIHTFLNYRNEVMWTKGLPVSCLWLLLSR